MSNTTNRPDWVSYYLTGAQWVSTRADCRRRQVGAILVADDNRVLGIGYNGTDPGRPGCLSGACPRGLLSYDEQPAFVGYGNCISRHAEENAIRNVSGGPDVIWERDPTMFITTQPCEGCQRLMADAGVWRAIWPEGELLMTDVVWT